MEQPSGGVTDAVVRLGRAALAIAVVVIAVGGLVAPVVAGHLSEEGDPVPLGLVQWASLEFEPESTGPLVWQIVVNSVFWLSLVVAALAVIRWVGRAPRVVSIAGKIITSLHLVCALLVYPVSGQVVDRAGEDWQFQWGWWVPILAGVLSWLAIWFDDTVRDAGWTH